MTQIITEEQKYINKLSQEFLDTHTREQEIETLAQLNNRESEDIKGYHGREILELLQNIDDAFEKKIKENPNLTETAKAKIEYKNNILTISNTGTCFDKDGIKSICAGNLTTKNRDYLGNKGTGFRSVLNWANKISIHSGNFNIEFSEEIANKKFQEIKGIPQIQKNIEYQRKLKKTLYIPMLSVPQNIKSIEKNEFDTVIQIAIDEQKNKGDFSVEKQIENFDFRTLLFLPNITEIHFETSDDFYQYKKEKDDNSTDKLEIFNLTNSNNPDIKETYYFGSKVISNAAQWKNETEKRDIKIAIAIPYDKNQNELYKIYSFFPCLHTQSPFNAIFHGTYNLGSDRNSITTDNEGANKKVIIEQLKFFVEFATKFTKSELGTRAIEILTPNNFGQANWKSDNIFGIFGLESFYLDLLSEAKILPTVNNNFISIKENPKLFTTEFPNVFKGEQFNDLLQLLETEANNNLVKKIASNNDIDLDYTPEILCNKINKASPSWSIDDKVKVFFWWEDKYKEKKILPKLLKDKADSYIEYKSDCYFVVGGTITEIPEWANFRELNSEYSNKLFEYAKNEEAVKKEITNENPVHRVLARKFSNINFQYVDSNTIISTIYKFVNKDYQKSIDFLKWLWTNYGQKENWKFNASDDTWLFPATEKITFDSKKCYFGKNYGNEFGKKLFEHTSYKEIIPYNTFDIKQDKMEIFKNFLKKFGVLEMPEIKTGIKCTDKNYTQSAQNRIKYPFQSLSELYSERDINNPSFTISTIENLETILEKLSIYEVIQWIFKDLKVENAIKQTFSENCVMSFRPKAKQYVRDYKGLFNYILWKFQNTKWVTINAQKYAPIECLFENNTTKRISGITPVISNDLITQLTTELNEDKQKIIDILKICGVKNKITELNSSVFYNILLNLNEETDQSGDISKSIYREIEKPDFKASFYDSTNKTKFFQEGKVFTKQKEFWSVSDTYFSNKKEINMLKKHLIDTTLRQGNFDNFNKVFGVKKFEEKFEITKDSIILHKENGVFQNCFQEFIEYAKFYSNKNENIKSRIKNLEIAIVSNISVKYNNTEQEITDNYFLLQDKSKFYILLNSNKTIDLFQISQSIEEVFDIIVNVTNSDIPNKIGELFRTNYEDNRKSLIKKEFGEDIFDREQDISSIETEFRNTISKINPNIDISKQIQKIDFGAFKNETNLPIIRDILKLIGTDIEQFKENGFGYFIDITPLLKKENQQFIEDNKSLYKKLLFNFLKKKGENEKSKFLNQCKEFESYEINNIENSVNFNSENKIKEKFPLLSNNLMENIDIENIYASNRREFIKEKQSDIIEELLSTFESKSLVYFRCFDTLNNQYNKLVETRNLSNKALTTANSTKRPVEQNAVTIKDPNYTPANITNNHRKGGGGGTYSGAKDNPNKISNGEKSEQIVYNKLVELFGTCNVIPKSGILETYTNHVGDDSLGYDLEYTDKSGNKKFVEIKTLQKRNKNYSFILSTNEHNTAKEKGDSYEIWGVIEPQSKRPEIYPRISIKNCSLSAIDYNCTFKISNNQEI